MTEQEKEIKKAVAYGIGYVCGKHNLKLSKKELFEVIQKYIIQVNLKTK